MARKLPWLQTASTRTAQTAHSSPHKRQKLLHPSANPNPNPDSNLHSNPNTTSNPRRSRPSRAASRTPSTSPPPRPPSQNGMHPGLHADDIYVMVEDEFLAIAQLYTAHLHHAEYQRLKALSHSRHVMGIDLSRPVTDATMRDETRRRKDMERREKSTDGGLDPLLSKPRSATEANVENEFEVEQDDPWQGTQLQRFMNVTPRKERRLMGLQGMASGTRAAAGFAAPERTGPGTPSKRQSSSLTPANEVLAEVTDEDDDDDDDDLDAPVAPAPSRAPSKPAPAGRREAEEPQTSEKVRAADPHAPLGKSILQKRQDDTLKKPHHQKKPAPPPPKRSFLDMTPLPKPIKPPPSPAKSVKKEPPMNETYIKIESTRQPHSSSASIPQSDGVLQRIKVKRQKEREEKERKRGFGGGGATTGLDEIPVFLV